MTVLVNMKEVRYSYWLTSLDNKVVNHQLSKRSGGDASNGCKPWHVPLHVPRDLPRVVSKSKEDGTIRATRFQ